MYIWFLVYIWWNKVVPTKINKITGKITDLNGGDIFGSSTNDMFLAEFVFVARK